MNKFTKIISSERNQTLMNTLCRIPFYIKLNDSQNPSVLNSGRVFISGKARAVKVGRRRERSCGCSYFSIS